jgi:hypothetical protein
MILNGEVYVEISKLVEAFGLAISKNIATGWAQNS